MEDMQLKDLWKSYDQKLEESRVLNLQSWALHLQCFEAIKTQKAKTKLNRLVGLKLVAVISGIGWVLFLGVLVYNSLSISKIFFIASAAINIIVTIIAIAVYIKHVVFIRQIDNSESIAEMQQKLAALQSSTMNIARIMFLTLPLYTTFYINKDMLANGSTGMWVIQVIITGLFTWLAIWLYRNINYKNVNKKWFKILFNSPEWTTVTKAMEFINEIEEFKKDSLV